MKFTVQVLVEGLNAYQVVDKLAREKIAVYSAFPQKNAITLEVARKDCKKVFAILQSSCYNVKKVSPYRWTRVTEWGKRFAGLLVGTLLAAGMVVGAQMRVLDVRIVGSGRYYEQEIRSILQECGITFFSELSDDVSAATMRILSLPRVSYCNVAKSGGVVTVEVQVSDESEPIAKSSLIAPVSGIVETLVVVRGTPLVQEGDEVSVGQTIADCRVDYGERQSTVIVCAFVRIAYGISVFYRGSEGEALAQAYLEYGQFDLNTAEREGDGYRITGTAFCEASCNMD